MGLEPTFFSTFYLECFYLTLNLFTGHQSSKPHVIAQLEREEKLSMTKIQTQRGRQSGADCRWSPKYQSRYSASFAGSPPYIATWESLWKHLHHVTFLLQALPWLSISLRIKTKVFKEPESPVVVAHSPDFTILHFSHVLSSSLWLCQPHLFLKYNDYASALGPFTFFSLAGCCFSINLHPLFLIQACISSEVILSKAFSDHSYLKYHFSFTFHILNLH